MPKIPTLDPQVRPQPLRPPQISQGTLQTVNRTNLLVAKIAQDAANVVTQVAMQEKRKNDSMVMTSSSNELRDYGVALEHGDEDQGLEGWRNLKGKNAFNSEADAIQKLDTKRNDIAARIGSSDLREQWLAESGAYMRSYKGRSSTHEASERDKVAQMDWEGALARGAEDALTELTDIEENPTPGEALAQFGAVSESMRQTATQRARDMGWSDDFIKDRMEKWDSQLLKAGITSLIGQEQATMAKNLFDAAVEQGSLKKSDELSLEKILEPALDREVASDTVDEWFDELGINEFYDSSQVRELRSRTAAWEDGSQAEKIAGEISRRLSENDEIRQLRDNENLDRLWEQVQKDPNEDRLEEDAYFKEHLGWRARNALRNEAKRIRTGATPTTNNETFYHAWVKRPIVDEDGNAITDSEGNVRMRDITDQERARLNLLELELSPGMFQTMSREQLRIRAALDEAGKGGDDPGAVKATGTARQHIDIVLSGYEGEPLSDEEYGAVEATALEFIDMKRAEVKKAHDRDWLTREEQDEAIRDARKDLFLIKPPGGAAGLVQNFLGRSAGGVVVASALGLERYLGAADITRVPVGVARMMSAEEQRHLTTLEVPERTAELIEEWMRTKNQLGRGESADPRIVRRVYAGVQANSPEAGSVKDFIEAGLSLDETTAQETTERHVEGALSADELPPDVLRPSVEAEMRRRNVNQPINDRTVAVAWGRIQAKQAAFWESAVVDPDRGLLDPQVVARNTARLQRINRQYAALVSAGMTDEAARDALGIPVPMSVLKTEQGRSLEDTMLSRGFGGE